MEITVITSLYKCEKYLQGFFDSADNMLNKTEYEFLLLHNAPTLKELEIININIKDKKWFRHIVINELEGLYETWNRGILLATGTYCAIWNVDDIRLPDSLILQKEILELNPEAVMSYGDIWGTKKYGMNKDEFYFHQPWNENKQAFYKQHMIGCFPMWRNNDLKKIGYFDEQFKLVADFEFQIRTALLGYPIVKTHKPLGYYLIEDPEKLSSNIKLQIKENNIVHLRYANFDKLNLLYLYSSLCDLSVFNVINYKKKIRIYVINTLLYKLYSKNIHKILWQFVRLPVDTIKFLKHEVKNYLGEKKENFPLLLLINKWINITINSIK